MLPPKTQKITVKGAKYKYLYCDTLRLLMFMKNHHNYYKSLLTIMKDHRGHKFNLMNFVVEDYKYEFDQTSVRYLLILNDKDVLATSRVIYSGKKGYINDVHTNKKYRGKGLCTANIKKIVNVSHKKLKLNKFELDVDDDNKHAIKCYEKVGFDRGKRKHGCIKMTMLL